MQFHPALNQTSAEKNSNWVLTRLEAYERRHRVRAQVCTYVFASSWWWFQRQWKKVCSSNTFIIFPNVSIFNISKTSLEKKQVRHTTIMIWFENGLPHNCFPKPHLPETLFFHIKKNPPRKAASLDPSAATTDIRFPTRFGMWKLETHHGVPGFHGWETREEPADWWKWWSFPNGLGCYVGWSVIRTRRYK